MFLFRDFPLAPKKEIRSALLKIYGVGWRKAIYVLSKAGLSYPYFVRNLRKYQFSLILLLLKRLVISDARIKRRFTFNIQIKIDNNSYAGFRHKLCLPVHGQRTRTNANTQRSKRIKRK
jgi:small subunit ribosomal protein S13